MKTQAQLIVCTGPESSGKTTLARALAIALHTVWVPEYARSYLQTHVGAYRHFDLCKIAEGQAAAIRKHLPIAHRWLLADTGEWVLRIWEAEKFPDATPCAAKKFEDIRADLYLLCAPDIPWQPDPLRENPTDRARLFERYKTALQEAGAPYAIVSGSPEDRLQTALSAILERTPLPE